MCGMGINKVLEDWEGSVGDGMRGWSDPHWVLLMNGQMMVVESNGAS